MPDTRANRTSGDSDGQLVLFDRVRSYTPMISRRIFLTKGVGKDKEKLDPLILRATDEKGADALRAEFEKRFRAGIGEQLAEKLKPHDADLKEAVKQLRRLRTAEDLSAKEQYERDVVQDVVGTLAVVLAEAVQESDKREAKEE